ncbi:RraA family protein [Herpetosiphon geysericola]|uniref:Putative 4-hydroxy-4-methyl-2-oxoglutarate aldolase n=1 Tax=Herpetosiphon geysericola TaxID=70996 RepID=A0A0P6XXI3_9CHLR|nr:RraA family protein [Herpetosiphon geysericola]KPL84917.1 diguanylate cyclase [Herpetosiphon geysericola]
MIDYSAFAALSPTTLADTLSRNQIMDLGIRPLWHGMPRVAGPAYTVQCSAGDNLMLHAAIYRAAPGSIIVVDGVDVEYAVAGGNVCTVAQERGIKAFIIDGVIRDLAEIRERQFPVFAHGVVPIPGIKALAHPLNQPINCGGVQVRAGDIVVADEEGIVVIPLEQAATILSKAQARAAKDATESLATWEQAHRAKIDELLRQQGLLD